MHYKFKMYILETIQESASYFLQGTFNLFIFETHAEVLYNNDSCNNLYPGQFWRIRDKHGVGSYKAKMHDPMSTNLYMEAS